MIRVNGCVPFSSRKERRQIYYELKEEFGNGIRIVIENNLITYSCLVDRNYI